MDSQSKFEMLKSQCVGQIRHVHKLTNELQICKSIIESFRATKEKLSNFDYTSGLPSKLNTVINTDEEDNTKTYNTLSKNYESERPNFNESPSKSDMQDYSRNLVRNIIVDHGNEVSTKKTDFQSYISSQAMIIEKILKKNEEDESNFKTDLNNQQNSPYKNINIKTINDFVMQKSPSISHNYTDKEHNLTKLSVSFTNIFNDELNTKLKKELEQYNDSTIDIITKDGYNAFESRLDNQLLTSKDMIDLPFQNEMKNTTKNINLTDVIQEEFELNEKFNSLSGQNEIPKTQSIKDLNVSAEKRKKYFDEDSKMQETNFINHSNSLIDVIQSGFKQNESFFKNDKKYLNISRVSTDNDFNIFEKTYHGCQTCQSNTNELQKNLHVLAMKKIRDEKKKKRVDDHIFEQKVLKNKANYSCFDDSLAKELNRSYDEMKIKHENYTANIRTVVKKNNANPNSDIKTPDPNRSRPSINFMQKNISAVSKNPEGTTVKTAPIPKPKYYYQVAREKKNNESNPINEKDYNLLDFFDSTSPHHPNYWTNIELGKGQLHISPSKKQRGSVSHVVKDEPKKQFDYIQSGDLADINMYDDQI